MKVIETYYRGILFRSRLEARWAVFFSELNIPFQYEPEGFELGPERIWYLPDFYLPKQNCYIEIKPDIIDYDSIVCRKCEWLCETTQKRVFLFFGGITIPDNFYNGFADNNYVWYPCENMNGAGACWDHYHLWCECQKCGQFDISFEGRAHRIKCECQWYDDRGHNYMSERLIDAYNSAITERFVYENVA